MLLLFFEVLLSYSLPYAVSARVCRNWTVFMWTFEHFNIKSGHLSLSFCNSLSSIQHMSASRLRFHPQYSLGVDFASSWMFWSLLPVFVVLSVLASFNLFSTMKFWGCSLRFFAWMWGTGPISFSALDEIRVRLEDHVWGNTSEFAE
jgi:hypothetical protein